VAAWAGAEEVMQHGWFRSVDWEALEAGQVDPPFVPQSSRCVMSNCITSS
jgi:hypothetical protein